MAEPFKNLISAEAVARLADDIFRANPDFDRERFVAAGSAGLEARELKARVRHVGEQLRPFLARDWPQALTQLLAAEAPEQPNHEGVTGHFYWWPALDLVERQGLAHLEPSVRALSRLTRRWSAEFAIRPYLDAEPERTWALLESWIDHPDLHVRRWLSEGSRPRLPWGMRLAKAVADPARGLRLLDKLVDDPSSYVRRSVANHLGDVAKDHPDLAVATAKRWLQRGDRLPLVQHALRTLLKKGDSGALALFGSVGRTVLVERFEAKETSVAVGGVLPVSARLVAQEAGSARVDIWWQWPGKKQGWSGKVMRGSTRELRAGEVWDFAYRLSLRPVSTRPTRAGEHRLTLRVNGEDLANLHFLVVDA
jgi:3-methyladenine DNA glycosylase AlkC